MNQEKLQSIVEVPNEVSFVKISSFMTDLFGKKRPLITREITHLFSMILSNIVGRALVTGFGQVFILSTSKYDY